MYLKNLLYGLIIGIGFIIPGVSGSVLATILGIYEETLDRISHLFKNFKNNIIFLLPLFIGIVTSILLFSKLILYFLNNKLNFISYVFIGLILGCVPYLFKEIKNKTNQKFSLIFFLISFILGIILFLIEKNNISSISKPTPLLMFLAGIFYAIGKIVPGISGAALLMLLGIYEYLLNFLANPLRINFNVIISFVPFIISFLISSIFIIKIINYLLHYHFKNTYSAIIGFVISSILFIYPGTFSITSIIILLCSFWISYYLSN